MYRAIPVGNKVCAARVKQRYERERAQRLKEIRPQIDTRPPETTGLPHIKRNVKRDMILAERFEEIERNDRLMLQKMHDMARKPETIPRCSSMPQLCRTPGGPAMAREYDRITQANFQMLHRLQNMKGELDAKKLEASYDKSKSYLRIACEYKDPPLLKKRVIPRRSASQAVLTRLPDTGVRASGLAQAGANPGAAAVSEDLADEVDDLRYALREERIIQGILYSVEMATDGRALAVSVYNAEADNGYELLLNADNHRSILSESEGDYTKLAERLYVQDSMLHVAPLGSGPSHTPAEVVEVPRLDVNAELAGDDLSQGPQEAHGLRNEQLQDLPHPSRDVSDGGSRVSG